MGFSRGRIAQLHEAMIEHGLESPYAEWLKDWDGEDDIAARITTRVECADWFDAAGRGADRARDPDRPDGGWFFAAPLELRKQIWPTEEYELARSLVDTDLPEDDLFAGVRERITA